MIKRILRSLFSDCRKPADTVRGRLMAKGMNRGHEPLHRAGRTLLSIRPGDRILDIGCGGGSNLAFFLTRTDEVWGVDYSPVSLEVARELNARVVAEGRCHLDQADVHDLPYDDGMFDIVTAFETTYFWGDLDDAFAEVGRVLKPGGTFLICNENGQEKQAQFWADTLEFPNLSGSDQLDVLVRHGFYGWVKRQGSYVAVLAIKK